MRAIDEHRARGLAPAVLTALAGVALLVLAWGCDRAWFERHVFLPYYFVPPTHGAVFLRGAVAALGLGLLVGASALGRRLRASPGDGGGASWVGILIALVAAVPAAEGILRLSHLSWRAAGSPRYELKIGHRDPRYGWVANASRVTTLSLKGRPYRYAVGPSGLRARGPTESPELDRPALVVTGESIASGYGLDYDDTFAVRCGRDLGLAVVDVAEGGYGVDQAYLRVTDLLPRIRHPAALVTVFVTSELGRGLRDDRPRLALDSAGALTFLPPAADFLARTQLGQLIHDRIPYAGSAALARATALAHALFVRTALAARARGARPLFVIVGPGPARPLEARPDAAIIHEVFDDSRLPHLLIDLDASERLDNDGHPNLRGTARMVTAIEAALRAPDRPAATIALP